MCDHGYIGPCDLCDSLPPAAPSADEYEALVDDISERIGRDGLDALEAAAKGAALPRVQALLRDAPAAQREALVALAIWYVGERANELDVGKILDYLELMAAAGRAQVRGRLALGDIPQA